MEIYIGSLFEDVSANWLSIVIAVMLLMAAGIIVYLLAIVLGMSVRGILWWITRQTLALFMWMTMLFLQFLEWFFRATPPTGPPQPPFRNISRRCMVHAFKARTVRDTRMEDTFRKLRDYPSLDTLRGTTLESYEYIVCNPNEKEKNLSNALLHYMFSMLRSEAGLENATGDFVFLTECPDLESYPMLKGFPKVFKAVKDNAVEILQRVRDIKRLTADEHELLIELIKVIMIKKAYEDLEHTRISIGTGQLDKLIVQMAQNRFMPSNKDMLRLVSKTLGFTVHVVKPGDRIEGTEAYKAFTTERASINAATIGHPKPPVLLEQSKDSYTLAKLPN